MILCIPTHSAVKLRMDGAFNGVQMDSDTGPMG